MMTRPGRRAFRTDVRFLIGLVLVIVSVFGVWLIVANARRTAPVLQAARTIVQGEPLASADFRVVEVGLGPVGADYLGPEDLAPGLVAARTIPSGELLANAATEEEQDGRTTRVVIRSGTGLPQSLAAGSSAELWAAEPAAGGDGFQEPRILVAQVVVAGLPEEDGVLGEQTPSIELVVDRRDVAEVLAAVGEDASLWVLPTGSAS